MTAFRHILAATLAFTLLAPFTRAQQTDLAFQRAEHLQHGINTSDWFAQSGDYSVQRLRTFTTPDDLRLIHQLGFDHIRLSIDAAPLLDWQRGQADGTAFVSELDRVVRLANHQDLAVIIDIHPASSYKATLFQGTDGVERFAMLWRALATHFAPLDPSLVFFEIMNEPEQNDPYRWQGIESFVAEQIRDAAPNNTIIACGAHWSGLEDLLQLEPLALTNIIYTFHDYEPFAFTHQGATWTMTAVQPERDIPYPSTPENVQKNLAQEPTLAGQYFVQQYGLDRWDAHRIDVTLSFAEKWSTLHHAPVYVGEFGVHRPYANPALRAQWIRDMRTMMEKHHLGWAMWDYSENFGAVTKKDGKTIPDQAIIDALGLKPQPAIP